MDNFLVKFKDGTNKVFSNKEIIESAKQQKKQGVKPMYSRVYRNSKGEKIDQTVPGFLVVSTFNSGAIVVYEHPETKQYIITQGWQGEFCIV